MTRISLELCLILDDCNNDFMEIKKKQLMWLQFPLFAMKLLCFKYLNCRHSEAQILAIKTIKHILPLVTSRCLI